MKKFFTLVIVSLLSAMAVQAQKVVINKKDGSKVTFRADEIQSVQFAPASVVADQFEGSYKGTDKISVIVPEVTYAKTLMGTLILGTYTISNIPYDVEKKAFIKAYKKDNIKFRFITKDDSGNTTKDQEYTFDKDVCKVVIALGDDGKLTINNTYQMGSMPMVIYGTFVGARQ